MALIDDIVTEEPKKLKGIQLYAQLGLFLTIRTIMNSGFRNASGSRSENR